MPDDLSPLKALPFSTALDELDDLLAQSGKAFLLGAGCSKCAGLPLTAELTSRSLESTVLEPPTRGLLQAISEGFTGAPNATIEDYLSELVDLIAISERRTVRGAASVNTTINGTIYTPASLKAAADQIKRAIATILHDQVNIDVHWRFIRAIHRPQRPGRGATNRPIDYFVLNYDTLIESALALHKVQYSDGMRGGTCAWWDPSAFLDVRLEARVMKLHGSIDWCEIPNDPMPRRIAPTCALPNGNDQQVLIWPASTKYRETQRDPYAQLIDMARRSLRPSVGTQVVLTVCGYSFGDSHINSEIVKALHESSGELTLVVFTADNEPTGPLKLLHDDAAVTEQVRIYAKRGFFHGSTVARSTTDLPWWTFENITRLLGGER